MANIQFDDDRDHSAVMAIAFEDAGNDKYLRLSMCIALYLALIAFWVPGFSSSDKVHTVRTQDNKPQKRKVLKPPPEQPVERIQTKDKQAKRAPMPDLTPDEPEPIVEPAPEPEMDLVPTDDNWEIGIPDGPTQSAQSQVESVARVGEVGVEPPVFTQKVKPDYPEKARKIRLQGYVILEAILRKDGAVDDIKVLRGLGKGKFGFEDAAAEALKQWEFLPGKYNGKPADVRMTLKIDFVLQ